MKILGRIVYALVAAIFLLYAINIAESIITSKYFEKYGPQAAKERDDEFFYGGAGFHKKEPIISVEENGYYINFYEVNKLFIHNKTDEKLVEEYIYILIYDDYNTIRPSNDEEYFISFYSPEDEQHYDVALRRFRELDVFVAVYLDSNEMSALLEKDAFLSRELTSISILHENALVKETLFTHPFEIKAEDFEIADVLLNHYEERNNYGVYDKVQHDVVEFRPILYLTIGIYSGLLIITTYLVYFFDFSKYKEKFRKKE